MRQSSRLAFLNIKNQCAKSLRAIAGALNARGIALTIDARSDVFLLGLGDDDEERVALTTERGLAYLDAGADLIFVPLLVSPPAIRRLADAFGSRLSLMAMPGAPTASQLLRCPSEAR